MHADRIELAKLVLRASLLLDTAEDTMRERPMHGRSGGGDAVRGGGKPDPVADLALHPARLHLVSTASQLDTALTYAATLLSERTAALETALDDWTRP